MLGDGGLYLREDANTYQSVTRTLIGPHIINVHSMLIITIGLHSHS